MDTAVSIDGFEFDPDLKIELFKDIAEDLEDASGIATTPQSEPLKNTPTTTSVKSAFFARGLNFFLMTQKIIKLSLQNFDN